MVEGAPDEPGVFARWEDDELIYVGRGSSSATIRAQLQEHLERRHACTAAASHYSWELSLRPAVREAEILQEFIVQHGRKPKCNADAS